METKGYRDIVLDEHTTARHLCQGRVVELSYCGDNWHQAWNTDERSQLYLRPIEYAALLKWLHLYTSADSDGAYPPFLHIGEYRFYIGSTFSNSTEIGSHSKAAIYLLRRFGQITANQFTSRGDNVWEASNDYWLVTHHPQRVENAEHYLIQYRPRIREEIGYLDVLTIESALTGPSISKASVTLADRLLGIIGMQTAPDGGYDVVLRNGIGELNLLQQTDRLNISNIVDDLIR